MIAFSSPEFKFGAAREEEEEPSFSSHTTAAAAGVEEETTTTSAGEEKKGEAVAEAGRREVCWEGCGRPLKVCICPHLPRNPLPTATTVVVLHHPHELRHKLSTVPLLSRCLLNCQTLSGRRLHLGISPLLDSLHSSTTTTIGGGEESAALFLFPQDDGNGEEEEEEGLGRYAGRCRVLMAFDGTWKHAREMVRASTPFLSDLGARRVSLCGGRDTSRDGESMFESDLALRKEPFRGCLSTVEAVARALRVLEGGGGGEEVERVLLSVLRAVVRLQSCHLVDKCIKPRPRLLSKNEKKKKDKEKQVEEEKGRNDDGEEVGK